MTYVTRPFFILVETFWPVLPLVVAVDIMAVYLLVFRERMDPRSFAFWMVLCIALPFAGFASYLLFGCTLYAGRMYGRKAEADRAAGLLDAAVVEGNDVRFFGSREEAVRGMSADISVARQSVHMEVRRIDDLPELMEALCSKSSEDVDVRVLFSKRSAGIRRLREAGVRTARFYKGASSLTTLPLRFRNRRSLLTVDGRIAYAGGGSMARVEGPGASRLEDRFLADWSFASGEPRGKAASVSSAGRSSVRSMSTGPDSGPYSSVLCYEAAIRSAEASLSVSEPYLVPDDNVHALLKLASLSGADVKVLVSRGRFYQKWNTLSAAAPLMSAGVRVFLSDERATDVVASVDGRLLVVGLAPFDGRAMKNDFHTAVLAGSEEASVQASRFLEERMSASRELCHEDYAGRTFSARLKTALSRILMLFNRGSHVGSLFVHGLGRLHGRHRHRPGHLGRGDDSVPDVHGALRPQVLLRMDHGALFRPPGGDHPVPVHGAHDILAHLVVQRPGFLEVCAQRRPRGPGGRHRRIGRVRGRAEGRQSLVERRRRYLHQEQRRPRLY
jgi:cardiolipin synthase